MFALQVHYYSKTHIIPAWNTILYSSVPNINTDRRSRLDWAPDARCFGFCHKWKTLCVSTLRLRVWSVEFHVPNLSLKSSSMENQHSNLKLSMCFHCQPTCAATKVSLMKLTFFITELKEK